MAGVSEISDQLMVMLSGIIDVVIERLPGVIGALLLLLIGWLLAGCWLDWCALSL